MDTPAKLALHKSHKVTLVVHTSLLLCPVHWEVFSVGPCESRTIPVGNEKGLKSEPHPSPDEDGS